MYLLTRHNLLGFCPHYLQPRDLHRTQLIILPAYSVLTVLLHVRLCYHVPTVSNQTKFCIQNRNFNLILMVLLLCINLTPKMDKNVKYFANLCKMKEKEPNIYNISSFHQNFHTNLAVQNHTASHVGTLVSP